MLHPRRPVIAWMKTFTLWMFLVIGLAVVGGYLGSWFTPTILAIARDGWSGLNDMRIVGYTAQVPEWLGGPWTVGRVAGVVMYGVSVFGGLLAFGRVGERLYQYVVVQSLGWLTEDEADEARRNEKQYF